MHMCYLIIIFQLISDKMLILLVFLEKTLRKIKHLLLCFSLVFLSCVCKTIAIVPFYTEEKNRKKKLKL